TFMFHEMGHEFGLDHSFGESSTPCASGDPRPGAYCDVFDIMSAMHVFAFSDSQQRLSGPTLNAFSRETLGWLHPSRVREIVNDTIFISLGISAAGESFGIPVPGEVIVLAPLNRPDIDGFQMVKFQAASRDPSQAVRSTYTIEFKEPDG